MIEIIEQSDVETLLDLNKYIHQWHLNHYPKIFKLSGKCILRKNGF